VSAQNCLEKRFVTAGQELLDQLPVGKPLQVSAAIPRVSRRRKSAASAVAMDGSHEKIAFR